MTAPASGSALTKAKDSGAKTGQMGLGRFVWSMVIAQFLVQVGAFTLPALLPHYMNQWDLSKTDGGWLVGIFFGAYVLAVPALVSLTDRFPTRLIYCVGAILTAISHLGFALVAEGFWSALFLRALAGIGWAGAYMPGLKALADTLEGESQSRAVSAHAAGVGVAGAMSFAIAGLIGQYIGPSAAFVFGGTTALIALGIAWTCMPRSLPPHASPKDPRALLDFRPVLRNRVAMAWIAGYTVHTWEMAALRAWGVTFLAATASKLGSPKWLPEPTIILMIAGLVGIAASIGGNELALRFGRLRIVTFSFYGAASLCLLTGLSSAFSAPTASLLVIVWLTLIFLDSSALTAGTVQAADPKLRGATMGLHSMCGYAGGFLGPLGVGVALDIWGQTIVGWTIGFGQLALITLAGYAALRLRIKAT